LKSLDLRTAELLDLDTGQRLFGTNLDENGRKTHVWIRTNRLDVLGAVEHGQFASLGYDMAVLPAPGNSFDPMRPQEVSSNLQLAQQEPNKITAISPPPEPSGLPPGFGVRQPSGAFDGRDGAKAADGRRNPRRSRAKEHDAFQDESNTFLFRTREDGLGAIQLPNQTNNPPGVKIRYKLGKASHAAQ
jgi:hypothetical protein